MRTQKNFLLFSHLDVQRLGVEVNNPTARTLGMAVPTMPCIDYPLCTEIDLSLGDHQRNEATHFMALGLSQGTWTCSLHLPFVQDKVAVDRSHISGKGRYHFPTPRSDPAGSGEIHLKQCTSFHLQ